MKIHATRIFSTVAVLTIFCVSLPLPLAAQGPRGTILGTVTDSSGAIIVGAKVTATDTETNVMTAVTTNSAGSYLLPSLIPGPYTVTAANSGFKSYTRPGIHVDVGDRITINISLTVGEESQTVRVTAESPLIDTSTASTGTVLDNRMILDLPTKDSMVLVRAVLVPGVTFTPQSRAYIRPFDTGSPSSMSANGVRSGDNAFLLDGAPDMHTTQIAYSPPQAVTGQVKVQTQTFDASHGIFPGAAVNMTLKTGTNSLHGQVNYFLQNPALNADNFFRLPSGKPAMRIHRMSASLLGPVVIPKIYNGRNKTFFTAAYEWIWSFDPSPFFVESVPTPAERSGDFSNLLALGPQYQIYDPFSTVSAGEGQFRRQPVPGNIIPPNQINPVAANISKLWDMPNQQGTVDGTNNYTKGKNAQDTYQDALFRIDENVSDKERFFVRGDLSRLERPENIRQSGTVGDNFYRFNRGIDIDNVYIFSPQSFVDARFSLTRFDSGYTPYQVGWDLASLGFSPQYINSIKQLDPRALKFPNIDVDGYSTLGGINTYNEQVDNTYDFAVDFTNLLGSHTLRYGADYRVYQQNGFDLGDSSGDLVFDSTYTNGPFNTSAGAPIGQGFASFLYGVPSPSSSFPINPSYSEQTKYWAFYVQDDWKVNTKLTISAGLRYEIPSPLTERYNRSVAGFDPAGSNSIAGQATQNYAQDPIPQVAPSQFNALGGLTFAGVGGVPRNLWNYDFKEFMPRVALAYSLTPKTVIRTGYGIYYEPLGVIHVGVNQTGFSSVTAFVGTLNNGQTYIADLTDPFRSGFVSPAGAAAGFDTYLGHSIGFFDRNLRNPYMQEWQFSIQQQLGRNSLLSVAYVGNRATGLRVTQDFDSVSRNYLSTSPVRDQATIDFLNSQVANPFYPLLPDTNLASTTVARSQLLKPYPQFSNITAQENSGYSWYHSMQLGFKQRLTHGLSLHYSFTWSKWMQATDYLNPTDRRPEEVISDLDRPFRHVLSFVYALPFGRGQTFLGSTNRVVNDIIGGWVLTGIYTYQSGQGLGFGNALLNPGQGMDDAILPAGQRTVSEWFNVNAFNRNSSEQLADNVQTLSSRFSGLRAPPVNEWDFSAIKNTHITERLRAQLSAEFINALNHPQFTPPNTTPTSTAFGQLSNTSNWQRIIEFGLKLMF